MTASRIPVCSKLLTFKLNQCEISAEYDIPRCASRRAPSNLNGTLTGHSCAVLKAKRLNLRSNIGMFAKTLTPHRGAYRDRHGRRRDAVDVDGAADESA